MPDATAGAGTPVPTPTARCALLVLLDHRVVIGGVEDGEVFQGFTVLGDYVYQLTGTAYSDENGPNPPSGHGNAHVSCVDLRTGELVQRSRTEAGYSLDYREPEGMAVQLTSPRRLCMGFASSLTSPRELSVYYKPQ